LDSRISNTHAAEAFSSRPLARLTVRVEAYVHPTPALEAAGLEE
jgi:hypothetical protein